ncbi:MAG: DinB superfamily protein [Gemmatimonadetes bacterium]|jgi:hypothetical protein|nr:DinB superfamily protein [Gemmatimonadota bacterium]
MTTQGEDLAAIFEREFDRLVREVDSFVDEDDLWTVHGQQKNSPGTLTLHLCGNLLHFVGAELGDTGFVRDRDGEFSSRMSRQELVAHVVTSRDTVVRVLLGLPDEVLDGIYPGEPPASMPGVGTRRFLMHLLWHFGWHEGHIYYQRLGAMSR